MRSSRCLSELVHAAKTTPPGARLAAMLVVGASLSMVTCSGESGTTGSGGADPTSGPTVTSAAASSSGLAVTSTSGTAASTSSTTVASASGPGSSSVSGPAGSSTSGTVGSGGALGVGGAGSSSAAASAGGATGQGGATGTASASSTGGAGGAGCASPGTYDETILCDHPVAYWAMNKASGTEPDLTGHGNPGTYMGSATALATLPNGDKAADFDGANQYLTIASKPSLSIPTTGNLTWEGWIKPDVLQFPKDGGGGYVDWMGKCADYAPTCEWEARMYSTTNGENRCNRLSAYVFNPSAGLGSAADWQPTCGLIAANTWYHVVGEYTTLSQPADCANAAQYPGSINIWVNGVEWSQPSHDPTGCMSQYSVVPTANDSPMNIGRMASDTAFPGAIGKVTVYDYLLTPTQITNHYKVMTGKSPTGSCGNTCSL